MISSSHYDRYENSQDIEFLSAPNVQIYDAVPRFIFHPLKVNESEARLSLFELNIQTNNPFIFRASSESPGLADQKEIWWTPGPQQRRCSPQQNYRHVPSKYFGKVFLLVWTRLTRTISYDAVMRERTNFPNIFGSLRLSWTYYKTITADSAWA